MENYILKSDAYKQTHWPMYDKTIRYIYSYLEARGGYSKDTVVFGLQMVLQDHFEGVKVQQWMIDDADNEMLEIFGTREYFNRAGWQRIVDVHGGKLPLEIKVVPEGTILPVSNAIITVVNTDPELPWLTNWAETLLLHVWHPITVATTSYNFNMIGKKYADMSGQALSPVLLNDFGYRGVSCDQSAGRGGAAHLTCSIGTDTLEGIRYAKRYYGANPKDGAIGVSVKASEHSVMTQKGREGEHTVIREAIENSPDDAIVSIVIDSYDDMATVNYLSVDLKEMILARKGKVVLRPDSGDPAAKAFEVLTRLWENVGGTEVDGYKVLDPHYGVIYGDGINVDSVEKILKTVVEFGKFAASNIVFGSGGGLLQACTRDTHKFAFKCSANFRNGEWHDVYKDPVTDSGKRSKRGRLAVILEDGVYKTIRQDELGDRTDILETVFLNGDMVKKYTFKEIRQRIGLLA
jgi:nicotinamide phosphoribosyltransferase